MQVDFGGAFHYSKFEHSHDLVFVAVDTTRGEQAKDVKGTIVIDGFFHASAQHWIFEEAAIGDILEQHMRRIGFITADADAYEAASQRQPKVANLDHRGRGESQIQPNPGFRQCPKCGQASLIRQEGCDTCTSCAYSRCG